MTSIIKVDTLQTAAGGVPTAADLGLNVTGSVLQVVQGTTSTNVTNSSTTYVDSGLSVNITPLYSSSKILVMAKQKGVRLDPGGATTLGGSIGLLRDSTFITKPSPSTGHHALYINGGDMYGELELTFLDSPSTTSQITYKTQQATFISGKNFITQQANSFTSVIIAMEIAG
jgi:hypothetical protein